MANAMAGAAAGALANLDKGEDARAALAGAAGD